MLVFSGVENHAPERRARPVCLRPTNKVLVHYIQIEFYRVKCMRSEEHRAYLPGQWDQRSLFASATSMKSC